MSIALTIRPMIAPPHPPQTSPLRFAASIRGFDSVCCILCVCGWPLRWFWSEADGSPGSEICGTEGASSAPPTLIDGIPLSLPLSSPKDIRGRAGADGLGPEILITGPSKSSSSLYSSAFAGNEIFGTRGVPCDDWFWFDRGAGGWKRTGDCERADENDFGVEGGCGGWSNCCLVGDVTVDCHCFEGDVVVCQCLEGDVIVVFHCGFAGEGPSGCCTGT